MTKLDVLYQFDENYAVFGGMSIMTLFETNTDIDKLTVYIAAENVSKDNLDKINAFAKKYNREIVYIRTDGIYDRLKELNANTWNGSLATWIKMFVVNTIPETVDQLLYIDSDTVIHSGLAELADMDLGEAPIAAIVDAQATRGSKIKRQDPYCNAGIIYFNLKYWRTHNTFPEMIEHLKAHVSEYKANDQDLMNDFFGGKILKLDPKFNFQGTHMFYSDDAYFASIKEKGYWYYERKLIEEARKNQVITHFFRFCGQYPWEPGNIHACRKLYKSTLERSPWKGFQYPKKNISGVFKVEKILYKLLPNSIFLKLLDKFK